MSVKQSKQSVPLHKPARILRTSHPLVLEAEGGEQKRDMEHGNLFTVLDFSLKHKEIVICFLK